MRLTTESEFLEYDYRYNSEFVKRFNLFYSNYQYNREDLEKIGKGAFESISFIKRVQTEDFYFWRCGIFFKIRDNNLVVLIPFSKDKEAGRLKGDLEKEVEVYTSKKADNQEIDSLIKNLSLNLILYKK
jgi:hypothetical protein